MSNKKLIIARGLPGSGKSALCKSYGNQFAKHLIEADKFWTVNGRYVFKEELLPLCHSWTLGEVARAMIWDTELIVVDDVHYLLSQVQQYIDLANLFEYSYKIILPTTPWRWSVVECYKRNTHGVPLQRIQEMLYLWEDYEISWVI